MNSTSQHITRDHLQAALDACHSANRQGYEDAKVYLAGLKQSIEDASSIITDCLGDLETYHVTDIVLINNIKSQLELVQTEFKSSFFETQNNLETKHKENSRFNITLFGRTKAGKSTLMNLLAKSDVFAENKLFATLDTTVRKVVIENVPFLLSDTVGFIRKLPTQLIEAFKSTLDEVREADILVHVVDVSHPDFEEQMEVVEKTLREIGAANKPVYVVFNKIDAYTYEEYDEFSLVPKSKENRTLDELKNSWIAEEKSPCIFISAINKTGIEKLRNDIYKMVAEIHAGRYPFNNFLY